VTICPICFLEFKNISSHLKTHEAEENNNEEEAQYQAERRVNYAKSKTFDNLKKKLEEQNEIILLQLQQKALLESLRSSPTQQQPKQDLDAVTQAIKLISAVREGFPQQEAPQESTEDMLLMEAVDLLKMKIANSMTPPLPPSPPSPPEDLINLEDLGDPADYEINEEVNNLENEHTNNPMDNGLLSETKPNQQRINSNKKTSGEQQQ